MSSLQELSNKLGKPGVNKLFLAAKEAGLDVTKAQVSAFTKGQSERQIFQKLQPARGQTAAGDASFYQLDLIDLKQDPAINKLSGETEKNILVLVNVFTRALWAAPLTDKTPKTVRNVFIRLLDQLPVKPSVISADAGKEFEGRFASLLVQKGIGMRTKNPLDKNGLGVIDRAIQSLKQILGREMAPADASTNWRDHLKKAVVAYNNQFHSTVHAKPKDVLQNEKAHFMTLQDNARKFAHNIKLTDARKDRLESAGAFRAPVPGSEKKFARSYQAKYGEKRDIRSIQGSTVTDTTGKSYNIKMVQAVPTGTEDTAQAKFGQNRALGAKKKSLVSPIEQALYDWLGTDTKSISAAATFLRGSVPNYDELLQKSNLNLAGVARGSERLEVVQYGYYVRRAGLWS